MSGLDNEQLQYLESKGIDLKDCSSCNKNLVGTTKPYLKHLILSYGSADQWSSHITNAGQSSMQWEGLVVFVCIYESNMCMYTYVYTNLLFDFIY